MFWRWNLREIKERQEKFLKGLGKKATSHSNFISPTMAEDIRMQMRAKALKRSSNSKLKSSPKKKKKTNHKGKGECTQIQSPTGNEMFE